MDRASADAPRVAVVGAGHNGLICAAYLARAGLATTLIEARSSVGGCASTVDAIGARVNICNCDHIWVRGTPIIDELDLEDFGLTYLDLDPCYVALSWDGGRPWLQYHDLDRTLDGLGRSHPNQVDAYRRYMRDAAPLASLVREVTNRTPGRRAMFGAAIDHRLRGLGLLRRLSRMSALDALRRWFDDDDLVRPALVVGPAVWGVDPATPGTGLAALTYAIKHQIPVGRPVGGSGAFTDAIHAAFIAAGGTTRTDARVASLATDADQVAHIGLETGERLDAEVVIVACDPRGLWTEWLTEPPAAARSISERWAAMPEPRGYESKLDVTLSEPPRYPQLDELIARDADARHATVLISPSVQGMRQSHSAWERGRFPDDPTFITNCPSSLDPSMRGARGEHVLSLEALWTPTGSTRDTDEAAAQWFARWNTLTDDAAANVVDQRLMSPTDYEQQFSMPGGHAASFTGSPLSAFLGRPRELTRHRTPIGGLYLSGAATYPGAGVWGAPGRNAANAVLADLGVA